ncbi:hypothetical protein BJY00DRAFT_12313 [Aspergillus carlsbadensis]|nr:hypothetical protein BJY00DRAFT_12313 [Aspergillus carlsbadensis]
MSFLPTLPCVQPLVRDFSSATHYCLEYWDIPLVISLFLVIRASMCLPAPKLSSFDLVRPAGSHSFISPSDLTATSPFTLASPRFPATAILYPYSQLFETSVSDVLWVGVRRPS